MLRACPTALQTTHTNLASRPSAPSVPSPPPLRQRGSGGDVCTQGAAAASSPPSPSCPAATAVAVGADHRGASRARLRRCRAAPLAAAAVRPRARQGPCALASGPRAALATAPHRCRGGSAYPGVAHTARGSCSRARAALLPSDPPAAVGGTGRSGALRRGWSRSAAGDGAGEGTHAEQLPHLAREMAALCAPARATRPRLAPRRPRIDPESRTRW